MLVIMPSHNCPSYTRLERLDIYPISCMLCMESKSQVQPLASPVKGSQIRSLLQPLHTGVDSTELMIIVLTLYKTASDCCVFHHMYVYHTRLQHFQIPACQMACTLIPLLYLIQEFTDYIFQVHI